MKKVLLGGATVALVLVAGVLHFYLGRDDIRDREEPIALKKQRLASEA